VGEYLIQELKDLRMEELKTKGSSHIHDVRGRGLMIGIDLDIPHKEIRQPLIYQEHCFTGCAGTHILRLLPPLCLSKADVDDFMSRLKNVLNS
jgi:acetylornithine aminotransferase